MNEPGKRIKTLRKNIKLTQQELADLIGVSRVAVSKWESQGDLYSHPKGEYITKLCKILKTTPDYIYFGHEMIMEDSPKIYYVGDNTEETIYSEAHMIPIISWVQAGDYHPAEVETDVDEIEKVATYERVSPLTYALKVIGESMTTTSGPYSFPPGSIIIIDPDQCGDTADGVFVIAKENGADSVTFKQLKYDGARPYLNPLNADYPKFFGEFRIIGKVIDFRPVKLP